LPNGGEKKKTNMTTPKKKDHDFPKKQTQVQDRSEQKKGQKPESSNLSKIEMQEIKKEIRG